MKIMYLLDANVLITAHRLIYPFDIAPAFWEQLLKKCICREVCFADRVIDEMINNDDALSDWLRQNKENFKIYDSVDQNVINNYSKIIGSVQQNTMFTPGAKVQFATVADSWIIAHALTYGHTIVTQETYEPGAKARVKIPNVCKEFDVKYIGLLEFMRNINMHFA